MEITGRKQEHGRSGDGVYTFMRALLLLSQRRVSCKRRLSPKTALRPILQRGFSRRPYILFLPPIDLLSRQGLPIINATLLRNTGLPPLSALYVPGPANTSCFSNNNRLVLASS